ncbi:hypothetical protein RI129_010214 [Pyrocoelia pectoralis]|uniref:Uncharacterized protein n=1 Tax=Pyrocoelia pectoralis TaxID=417401 RepID=A0AAN7V6A1_9COLE
MKVHEKAAKLRKSNLIQVTPQTDKQYAVEKRRRSVFSKIKEYFLQYCETTTIHGMRYVGERGRYFMERLVWTVIIFSVSVICLGLIRHSYLRWRNSPVIVTFESSKTSISKIPFPAVTLCPETKFNKEILNYTNMALKITNGKRLTREEYLLSTARVQWLGKTLNANEALFPIFTSEGLCYTFNMLANREVYMSSLDNSIDSHNWLLEDGYLAGDNTDTYPRRAFMPGVEGGLVILHHPCEFPDVDNHFRLPLDQAVVVSIKPSLLTVSPELLHYSPKDRKCYFAKEKYLATFKVYTQQNCLDECLSNYTLKECKCIPFYFPLTYMKIESNAESGNQQCECLPLCTSLSYDVETSQTDWNAQKVHKHLTNYENRSVLKGVHNSKLYVHYQDRLFFSYNRKEVYGVADFFSNMGGLFGLFLGLSVTSVIELVYFFTIRIVCNIRKYGRNAWSGELEASISA